MKFSLTFTLYSLSLSFLIGIVAAFFLGIVNFLIHIVWVGVPSALHLGTFYPLVIGLIGGVLVGLFQSRIGPYPKTMHETIQEFQTTKRVHYEKQIWKNFVAAIIVLAFGASLGPEAALASILGGLISWLGDRLKLTMFKKEELLNLSLGALLATIFHAPFMGITTPLEEGFRQGQIQVKWKKTVLYILSTVAGLLGFAFVNQFFPKEKVFAIRLGAIHWEGQVIYLLLPALLLGMAFGYFFLATERFFDYLALKINQKILLALVAGLCIGLFGIISPYFLFSGEHALFSFTEQAGQLGVGAVLLIAIGKTLLTNLCFAFGWRGGKIFPALFASVAISFVLVNLFPYTPGLVVGIVTTASLTVILKQPVIIAALLLFLFPLQFFPAILVTAWLVHQFVSKLSQAKGNA
ncbi:chloride channel protein [Listeria monocytogenes]|jgi:H+/Cl- antiporter ClcA|uniref:Chloride channel protein n=1 Tax=Listeria monocytogenes TaxID=1639 RepID=A0A3D7VL88_LISMN|nr:MULTISPECIES: chloride channel protein [Bacilli]EAC2654720.1 chloride channel protein [Listeria monocytogenes]EAC2666828.1 chloride channel protein [Listeria monocytogenes]EAC3241427.1 chloride channel protein [Listeria monocytogenes]EAC3603491.1 chloride channel protein [Listeria monocytogenes]EAC3845385.1 chloride channel protein [Listeria monocytogenes]